MTPCCWVYWRIKHLFGWHYMGGGLSCYFCGKSRPIMTKEDWARWFDEQAKEQAKEEMT